MTPDTPTRNLLYSLRAANEAGEMRHAQVVMAELGIRYEHAVPQSMADSWTFYGCENIPPELPPYLRPRNDT